MQHSKEDCIASAEKHKTKKSWQSASPKMVTHARRKGWYLECTSHMHEMPKGRSRIWTKELCAESALNFTNVSEWKESNGAAYTAAKRYGWLKSITKHFKPLGNKIKRFVYIVRVKNTKMVYVGLSRNIAKRWATHLSSNRFIVIQNKYGQNCLRLFTCTKLFKAEDAALIEENWIKRYKAKGFKLLNKKQGGGLGASASIWTYDAVKNDANNYDFVGTWSSESHAAYNVALQNGWLERLVSEGIIDRLINPKGFWTKQRIKASALKYTTRTEWSEGDPKAYSAACMQGFVHDQEIINHFVAHLKWTDERLTNEVAKYETLMDFRNKSPSAYSTLKKQKRLKKFTTNLKRVYRTKPWTKSEILITAKKYNTKNEFHIHNNRAYRAAKKMDIFEEATRHMGDKRKKK